jgi:hypothetical protein
MFIIYFFIAYFILKLFIYLVNNKTDILDPYINKSIDYCSNIIKKLKSKWS